MRNRNAILGLVGAAGLVAAGSTCAVSFSDYYEAKGGEGGAGTTTSGTPTSSGASPTSGSVSPTTSTGGGVDRDWPNWKMPNSPSDVTNQGAPNPAAYQDNRNGTVTDTVTGLMWQKVVAPGGFTHPNALLYCSTTLNAGGGLGGHTDWRLPTRIELVSLLDISVFDPSINATYFPNTPAVYFWSATPVASVPSYAWLVGFLDGTTSNFDMTSPNRVRCVR